MCSLQIAVWPHLACENSPLHTCLLSAAAARDVSAVSVVAVLVNIPSMNPDPMRCLRCMLCAELGTPDLDDGELNALQPGAM